MSAVSGTHWPLAALQHAECPLCGPAPGVEVRFDFPPFQVVACRGCRLSFLSPRLSEDEMLKLYQSEAYFSSGVPGQGYDEYLGVRANWHRTFRGRLQRIQRYRPTGRVLDVGCGPGYFMEVAAGLGYDVWGVDASAYAITLAQGSLAGRVRQATLETAGFEPESFDVITAFDTFEHIYDPLRFLDTARGLLKPRGLLAMTTPNARSWLARLSGRRWVSFKIPEHVFYWSPGPLARALAGRYAIQEVTSAGQVATLGFVARRLLGWGPNTRGPAAALLARLNRLAVYVNNGSLTVLADRR